MFLLHKCRNSIFYKQRKGTKFRLVTRCPFPASPPPPTLETCTFYFRAPFKGQGRGARIQVDPSSFLLVAVGEVTPHRSHQASWSAGQPFTLLSHPLPSREKGVMARQQVLPGPQPLAEGPSPQGLPAMPSPAPLCTSVPVVPRGQGDQPWPSTFLLSGPRLHRL